MPDNATQSVDHDFDDEKFFDEQYREWLPRLVRRAESVGLDHATAFDVAHETFLGFLRSLRSGKFDRKSPVGPWLCTVLQNWITDRHRPKARRRQHVSISDVGDPVDKGHAGPAENAESTEIADVVRRSLGELPPSEREALCMKYFDGLTEREIAEKLGTTRGTVSGWITRAVEKLRKYLQRENHSGFS